MSRVKALKPDQLYKVCRPNQFKFRTTADLPDLAEPIGQERAIEALRFGMTIEADGYNLFALGPSGYGKHSMVTRFLERQAQKRSTHAG